MGTKMNLVNIANLWRFNELTNEEVEVELSKIDIFEPIISENELEDSVYTIGDGNSLLEVSMVLSREEYIRFMSLLKKQKTKKDNK